MVSFNKRKKLKVGIETRPSFSLSQHKRNKEIVLYLQKFFGCGRVRFSKRDQNYKFEVRGINDLTYKIIPHFTKYPLQTSKRKDFDLFKQVCLLVKQNKYLSYKGLKQIVSLAYQMNNGRAGRYSKSDLLRIISKMKV